jgi:ABC-type oligopeptide transport system substrate-binding subunit
MAKPGQFVVKPMTAGRPGPFIWFNMANDIVKDVRVRKAIGLLVEPEQFVIAVSGTKEWGDYNIAIMTGGGSGYGLPKADVDKLLGRDMAWDARVAAAKKLMADAGKSAGFKAKLTYGNYDVHQRRAALLADTLKKNLNIELTLNPVEPAQARTVFLKGDFDLCIDQLTAVIGDPDEIVSYYKTGGSANQSKYSNADVDKLFDQQSQSLDVAARRQITRQIERQLLTDLPQIPTAGLVTQISWASYVNYPMQMMSYGSNQALEYVWLNK